MNLLGLVCALTTFFNIWLGHVAVRHIEARVISIKLPSACFAISGLILEGGALLSSSAILSAVLGVSGLLVLWDALELHRQQRRVIKGHAPANPDNPRHRHILEEHPTANTIHWLKREPQGHPISPEELNNLRRATQ